MNTVTFLARLQRGEPVTLSALGDSLTYGYLVQTGYLDMVEASLRAKYPIARLTVLNHGVCGDTVLDGLARAGAAFFRTQPELGFIEFGLNDCFQGITPQRYQEGLTQLVEECRRRVPGMTLLVLPPVPVSSATFDQAAQPFREACAEVAARFRLDLVDFATPWHAAPDQHSLWQPDGVHPTESGYHIMAEAVLTTLGALPPA